MAIATTTALAIGSLAVAAGGAYMQYKQQNRANQSQRKAEKQQELIQQEQQNANAQQANMERRQQIRQERVRRAQIVNAAANTGTSGSSGEAGALASMSTQLGSNLGANQSAINRGQRISGFAQSSANFMGRARSQQNKGQMFGQISGLGMQSFQAAGGWNSIFD